MPANNRECEPCNQKNLLWTFVWQGKAYQSANHGKITTKRRQLGANTARLMQRPRQHNALQI